MKLIIGDHPHAGDLAEVMADQDEKVDGENWMTRLRLIDCAHGMRECYAESRFFREAHEEIETEEATV